VVFPGNAEILAQHFNFQDDLRPQEKRQQRVLHRQLRQREKAKDL
jgi:hypothetical protein